MNMEHENFVCRDNEQFVCSIQIVKEHAEAWPVLYTVLMNVRKS